MKRLIKYRPRGRILLLSIMLTIISIPMGNLAFAAQGAKSSATNKNFVNGQRQPTLLSARKQASKRLKQVYQHERAQHLGNWVGTHQGYTGKATVSKLDKRG